MRRESRRKGRETKQESSRKCRLMEVKDGDETGNESGLSRPTWLTLSLASDFNTKYRHAIATGEDATEREAYDCKYRGSGKYS